MKKLIPFAFLACLALPLLAQEEASAEEVKQPQQAEPKRESTMWPACFAICQWPRATDVVGVRLALPFSTAQGNVTGIDLGLWGRCLYFEGLQVNILRNDVKDDMAGFEVGLYNSIGAGDLLAMQIGLWNEAGSMRGFQVGLVNVCGEARGFQVGLINRSETMYGYQVGLINIIRDAEFQFMPIINIGF
mgnify:CR=1 FL=1